MELFHASSAFVRGIMGPVGSGKSVACCMEAIIRAHQQRPSPDGIRRTRFAIVRNTYPELRSTTIKTWQAWISDDVCPIVYGSPITGHYCQGLEDGTHVDSEIFFLALDRSDDVKKLLSFELTGAWINEARFVPKAILDALTGRVGRYPAIMDGGCSWRGVWMDSNPPDDDHWWYEAAEVTKPEGHEYFRQPGGIVRDATGQWALNPKAENIANLDAGYYQRQIAGKSDAYIGVYLGGNYGVISDGRPVFHEFSDNVHVAKEPLRPYPGFRLFLGWDFGLTPACIIGQLSARGQLRILAELTSVSVGVRAFARSVVKPYLLEHFRGYKVTSVGDPAGTARAQSNETTCMDELRDAGIPTEGAPTNEFMARRECVAGFLSRMIEGEPGFLLSPTCKQLRSGLGGKYFFQRVRVPGEERFKDEPAKNKYSHPCDALQYLALACDPVIASRERTVVMEPMVEPSPRGWT
jgi:hypothetical protein